MSGGGRRQSHEGADRIRHDIVHHHAGQTTLEKEKKVAMPKIPPILYQLIF